MGGPGPCRSRPPINKSAAKGDLVMGKSVLARFASAIDKGGRLYVQCEGSDLFVTTGPALIAGPESRMWELVR